MPKGIAKNGKRKITPNKGWFKKGQISINRGKKNLYNHTRNAKKKLSKAGKGRIPWNKYLTKEIDERVRKQSENNKGEKNGMFGIKHSKEFIENMSGEKSHFWVDGRASETYTIDWTDILRESIRCRDNYICQECGIHQDELMGRTKKLDIHHIDYDKKNCNPENLISLCRNCHMKTNMCREYWIKHFQ